MAITKLPRNAIADNAINADKIEDGTVAVTEISGTVSAAKLNSTLDISGKTVTLPNTSVTSDMISGTIANAKLSNSSITVRGTARNLGDTFTIGTDVDWQSVQTGDFTAAVSKGYFVNTSSAVVEVTLPSSASIGDIIAIKDYAGTFATNNLTIARNGHNIQGIANDSLIKTNRASLVLIYVDSTKGWLFTDEHNVGNLVNPQFTSATGGTIATSGDFKIHIFTGDGCFVVATAGNQPVFSNPSSQYSASGPGNVDYLVIAGGGGGRCSVAGGGGGAGGHRTSYPSPAGVIPVSAQTYPITVGGGGAASTNGANSVFSTITSTGGGAGGNYNTGGSNGGSGGGGGGTDGSPSSSGPGGTGNTPPTSPSQGNDGGSTVARTCGQLGGSGGGGIGGSGSNSPVPGSGSGGAGGNGGANSITASSVTRAGGGGGGNRAYDGGNPGPGTGGAAGPGGGGKGGGTDGTATNGTTNQGGGGGGKGFGSFSPNVVGTGGSGIVIIRYKFQ